MAWAILFVFAGLAFSGIAHFIAAMLESSLLGWLGAVFVVLPWAPVLSAAMDSRGRERR